MKLTVAAVGRVKAPHFAAACDEYAKRLERYATVRIVEVKDVRSKPANVASELESERLLARVAGGSRLVALDEHGALHTSVQLADRLNDAANRGQSDWTFCIGGPDGHGALLRERAVETWSLSPLTLPHELARVVVLEQLYRVMTIIRGERYHREG